MQRTTKQRTVITEMLSRSDDFISAQALHDRLRAAGESVGIATVYRTLQAFAEDGSVDVLHSADGESLYRRCGLRAHHHHLVCRRCGRAVEIAASAVEDFSRRVAADNGFTQVEHTLEIFGLCPACTAAVAAGNDEDRAAEPGA